jgi:hypothetical protein
MLVRLGPMVLLAASFVLLLWHARRSRELFVLSVQERRTLLVRGRVPLTQLIELRDVIERAGVARATLRVMRADGHARLVAEGLAEPALQQARNALGIFPMHKLLAAPAPRTRNLGQWLGIAWLAHWLARRES